MTATLNDVNSKIEKKLEPSAEEVAAVELVRMAKEQGLSLTGPDGRGSLPARSAWGRETVHQNVLETALNE